MKKKRAYKRIAKRRAGRPLRILATARLKGKKTTPVSIELPANLARFLKGASDYSTIPMHTLINALLVVQIHSMREKAA